MRALFIGFAIALASASARADFFNVPRVKPLENKAAGGLFEETAAGGALLPAGWRLSILRAEGGGTLSRALDIYGQVKDIVDFNDRWNYDFQNANYLALPQRADELKNILRRMNYAVSLETRGELLGFYYGNKRFGRMSAGGYWEGMAGLRFAAPDVDKIQVMIDGQYPYIGIGKETEATRGLGFGDVGGYLSYGRAFSLPKGMEIAGGVRVRVFRRWLVPAHTMVLSADLRGKEDIKAPSGFQYLTGLGGALDLSATLAVHDRFFDTKVSVGLRNTYGQTWYGDGSTLVEQPKPSLEAAIKPLHWRNRDHLVVGIGVDEIEGDNATLGLGCYYVLNNRWFNVTLRAGFVISRKGLLGERDHFFTTGLSMRLAVVYLSGLYEQSLSAGGYNAGAALGLEI